MVADFFQKIGLERLEFDHGVFVSQDCQLFLAIYMDKLFFFSSDDFRLTDI